MSSGYQALTAAALMAQVPGLQWLHKEWIVDRINEEITADGPTSYRL